MTRRNRKRLAMAFGVLGVLLMGVDLMMTRNFFTHIGELMLASLASFALAIFLDRDPKNPPPQSPFQPRDLP